ncbi:GAF domain-containing protein, partial [Streptomyces sp. NPDC002920]
MRTGLDRALTFAGATSAAVYAPGAGNDELRLVDAAGDTPAGPAPPERLAVSGDSPAARAFRTDRPLWLTTDSALGALPLDAEGRRLGCLLVVGESPHGFEADQRRFLERYADAVAGILHPATGPPEPSSLLDPALRSLRVGSFVLIPDTGLRSTARRCRGRCRRRAGWRTCRPARTRPASDR